MKLQVIPISLREANEFVINFHRHSKKTRGHKYSIGASDGENLVGVAIVGRPVARKLDDGFTAEVLRVCVKDDSPKNTCSYRIINNDIFNLNKRIVCSLLFFNYFFWF